MNRSVKPLITGVNLVIVMILTAAFYSFGYIKLSPEQTFQLKRSHRLLAYKVSSDKHVRFRIQPGWKRLELISNLDLTEDADESKPLDYALQIRLLDKKFDCLSNTLYWERTRRTTWTDPKTKHPLSSAFYLYESVLPCDSRITTIQLPEHRSQICFIEVALAKPPGAVASIRAYHHENFIGERELKSVKPLNRRLRAKIARHNIFGLKATDMELKRFLRDIWRQIPAEGHPGTDYLSRALFLYDYPLPVPGKSPDKWIRLSEPMHLPFIGPATLTIQSETQTVIHMHRITDTGEIDDMDFDISPGKKLRIPFGAGRHLVTLTEKQTPARIRKPTLDPPGAWIPGNGRYKGKAVPPVQHAKYARILPEGSGPPVVLELPMVTGNSARDIKIICRMPLQNRVSSDTSFSVQYRFKNDKGLLIMQGTFKDRVVPSEYALYETSDNMIFSRPSRPSRYILHVPDTATRLEFTSDTAVDASFFSMLPPSARSSCLRPIENKREPDRLGKSGIHFIEENRERTWLFFRPSNFQTLDGANRWITLVLPAGIRETEMRPGTHTGTSTSRTIKPLGEVRAETIYEISRNITDTASLPAPHPYHEIIPGRNISLQITGNTSIFPRIQYRLKSTSNPSITLIIDGEKACSFRPLTHNGRWSLPALAPGRHTLAIQSASSKDRFYLYAHPSLHTKLPLVTARRIYRLDPGNDLVLDAGTIRSGCNGLNILVYPTGADNPGAFRLTMSRTGGAVETVSRARTPDRLCFTSGAEKNLSRTEYTVTETDKGTTLYKPARFFYPIRDDIIRKNLLFNVTLTSKQPVYVRFFTIEKDAT